MSGPQKLSSPKVVQMLLQEHGLKPRKRWGQNFLCDENTLQKIISVADLKLSDCIFEIGGGLGTLSQQIAPRVSQLVVVEIDPDILPILEQTLAPFEHSQIIQSDVLELDWSELFPKNARFKTLGNLPYNITAPLIEKLIENRDRIESATWMMQLEVAEKITASPGTRASSSLGVFVQSYCDVKSVLRVSKNAFYPKPEVDSAVVEIRPCEQPKFSAQPETFNRVVRAAYGMRRKTLLKALSLSPEIDLAKSKLAMLLKETGIDGGSRGENLLIEEFDRIALALDELE